MILYHIEKHKHRKAWPPRGTLFAEGRWNKPGQWIIYSSPSIALAKLEILANDSHLPMDRVCMEIEVDENANIMEVQRDQLMVNWYEKPYPNSLHLFTSRFLSTNCLLLKIPSAQSHREFNYLINAQHPKFHENVKLINESTPKTDNF